MRLNHLCEKLRRKLVGRKGLGPTADSVIASIKAERGKRKSASTSISVKSGTSKARPAILKKKFVRKAKIMRLNNGSTPNVGVGAKIVVNGSGSLSTPNQNVDSIISGNGFTHSSSINVGGTSSTPPTVNMDGVGGHGLLPPA